MIIIVASWCAQDVLPVIMPRPELLGTILGPGPVDSISPDTRIYIKPPLKEGILVGLAVLYAADEFGWASVETVIKFCDVQFPYFRGEHKVRLEMGIRGLNESTGVQHFNTVTNPVMKYQIKAAHLLSTVSWIKKYISFDEGFKATNRLYMKSPDLIQEILSLPPPNWKNYYCPTTTEETHQRREEVQKEN